MFRGTAACVSTYCVFSCFITITYKADAVVPSGLFHFNILCLEVLKVVCELKAYSKQLYVYGLVLATYRVLVRQVN